MLDTAQRSDPNRTLIRRIAQWLILIGGAVLAGAFVFGGAISMLQDPELYRLALDHFAATIGLP
ncbi:MAG: hypothetical protein ACM3SP_17060 [Chloroflexota bacterium]